MRWALLALVACGSSSPPPAQPQHTAPKDAIDPARAYELGKGVARDYRKAAALYGERCRDGCGDLAACKKYFSLAGKQRGVVLAGDKVATLAGAMCDRGSTMGCFAAIFLGVRDDSKFTGKASDKCEHGDAEACLLVGAFNFSGSSSVEKAETRAREKACELGVMEECSKMFEHACEGAKSAMACVENAEQDALHETDADTKKLREDNAQHLRITMMRLGTECDGGDVDACEGLPGREVDPMARCDAGDYGVCKRLGSEGNAQAAEVACRAGLGGSCGVEEKAPAAAIDGFMRLITDQCQHGDPKACAARADFIKSPCSQ
jgi:TPR repeat protein